MALSEERLAELKDQRLRQIYILADVLGNNFGLLLKEQSERKRIEDAFHGSLAKEVFNAVSNIKDFCNSVANCVLNYRKKEDTTIGGFRIFYDADLKVLRTSILPTIRLCNELLEGKRKKDGFLIEVTDSDKEYIRYFLEEYLEPIKRLETLVEHVKFGDNYYNDNRSELQLTVTATQFNGLNKDYSEYNIKRLSEKGEYADDNLILLYHKDGTYEEVHVGDWLLQDFAGNSFVLTDEKYLNMLHNMVK